VVSFAPQRLITEVVIYFNAIICTLIVLLWGCPGSLLPMRPLIDFGMLVKKTVLVGLAGMVLSVTADWGIVRTIYDDEFAGQAGNISGLDRTRRPPKRNQKPASHIPDSVTNPFSLTLKRWLASSRVQDQGIHRERSESCFLEI